MNKMNGSVEGKLVATYRKNNMTWNCKISGNFYCATFNVRKTNRTYYSTDKNEINELIKKQIADGFKRVF